MTPLSCWTALFPYLSWLDACHIISTLGFSCVDLIARPRSAHAVTPWDALDLEPITESPQQKAAELRSSLADAGLEPTALFVIPPALWRELEVKDVERVFQPVAEFCHQVGLPTIVFAASDIVGPGQITSIDFSEVVSRLQAFVVVARDQGVSLALEPNFSSAVRTPKATRRLAENVSDLGLVIDPAHFVVQGYRQEELEPLWPFAKHVHARQARPGFLQARLEGGTIDFAAIVAALNGVDYEGAICIENILLPDAAWLTSDYLDPVAETVALRDLLQSLM